MLEIDNLGFRYSNDEAGEMVFDLTAKRGEITSLIGPSGAGKTSLLNLIAGFSRAHRGRILIDGRRIDTSPPAKRPVTMVFQSNNLFPHLDVFTNVALGINPSLNLTRNQREAIDRALEMLGIENYRQRKPGELSGGQQQRATLARALVRNRDIMLLDEPFAALGPAMREDLIAVVKALVLEHNHVALLVSHQPADALLASPTTVFLSQGRVLATGPTKTLLINPLREEIADYLGSA